VQIGWDKERGYIFWGKMKFEGLRKFGEKGSLKKWEIFGAKNMLKK
jgi:hypothetical protein